MIFSTLRELDTNIRAGAPLPVYLLYGEESRQIEAARERIVREVMGANNDANLFRLDGSGEVSWDSVGDMLWSVSFFGGRRCVVIDDLNLSLLHAAAMEKIAELLREPSAEAVLLITVRNSSQTFNKKDSISTKLLSLCDKAGGVCRFAVMTRGDVAKLARNIAAHACCVLEPEDSLLLADYCGLDSMRLQHEMEKLCAYHAAGGRITRENIESMVSPTVDANVFQLGDRIMRGDLNGAMSIVADLLFLQERPESILTILTMSFTDYYRAFAVRRGNIAEATARRELGYGGSYRFTKALEQYNRLDAARLGAVLETLAEADARIKSGSADGRTVLEITIIKILRLLRGEEI